MDNADRNIFAEGFFKKLGAHDKKLVSRDIDEVSCFLHRNSGPYHYEQQDRSQPFAAKLEFKKLTDLTVSYGWFGPAMIVSSRPDEPVYSLFSRLHGSSEYTVGKRVFVTSPRCGALLPGLLPLRVRTNAQWHVFGTNFSVSAIERELGSLLAREISEAVEFDPMVNFDRGAGRVVNRMLRRLYNEVAQCQPESPAFGFRVRQMERSLITLVLEGLRHNYSNLMDAPGRTISLWQVRRVEEFIRQCADEALSLGDLAAVGGTSARSLQYTFQRYRGCSPMSFLRKIRFERVRDQLLRGERDTTVTSVALRWGFPHFGRFAAEYRMRFEESPSATLRRNRKAS